MSYLETLPCTRFLGAFGEEGVLEQRHLGSSALFVLFLGGGPKQDTHRPCGFFVLLFSGAPLRPAYVALIKARRAEEVDLRLFCCVCTVFGSRALPFCFHSSWQVSFFVGSVRFLVRGLANSKVFCKPIQVAQVCKTRNWCNGNCSKLCDPKTLPIGSLARVACESFTTLRRIYGWYLFGFRFAFFPESKDRIWNFSELFPEKTTKKERKKQLICKDDPLSCLCDRKPLDRWLFGRQIALPLPT